MLSLDQQNRLRDAYRRQQPGWRPATEVYADLARSYAHAHARVLDLGCGRGGLVEQLDLPAAQFMGIDMDLRSLREHRLQNMPRAVSPSDLLPLAPGRFDVVLGSWLLEHLDDPARTFAEVRRVLLPGGVFVFITPNARHPLALLNRALGRAGRLQALLVEQLYGRAPADTFPTRYLANSAEQLDALAQSCKLDLLQLQSIADPTYLALHPALAGPARLLEDRLPADRHIHLVGVMRRPPEERA